MTPDEIRRLSDELASDPGSLAFIALADALRRSGQLDQALRVALRGLERHAYRFDAHDVLARVYLDRGELARAADEWETTLQLSDGHLPALKGLGYLAYRRGDLRRAERCLRTASEIDASDAGTITALARIREALGTAGSSAAGDEGTHNGVAHSTENDAERRSRHVGESPPRFWEAVTPPLPAQDTAHAAPRSAPIDAARARTLFASILDATPGSAALLLDADGLVLAGECVHVDGGDASAEVGAELAGVSREARRALVHLGLGEWQTMHVEAEHAMIGMASAPDDALALVALPRETPAGFVRLLLGRVLHTGREWLSTVR